MKPSKPTILIIGAGLAGLAAARKLIAHHYNVHILEARDRIGGRTWTDDSLGIPFDLGAFMFHGTEGHPLVAIARDLNLTVAGSYGFDFGTNQDKIDEPTLISAHHQFYQLMAKAGIYARTLQTDVSLYDAMESLRNSKDYPVLEKGVNDWMHNIFMLRTAIGAKYLSASHWYDKKVDLGGEEALVISGYKPIIEYLAKEIPISLAKPINRIVGQQNDVQVYTRDECYTANAVIVTVPLGVLKKKVIEFSPPLPEYKQKAIDSLDVSLSNRIALRFPHAFWSPKQSVLSLFGGDYRSFSLFNNYYPFTKQPILVGFTGGEVAKSLECLGEKELIDKAMSSLQQLYGKAIPYPEDTRIMRWGQDPYAFGSGCYIGVGSSGQAHDELARNINDQIYFAGDATIRQFPGTTQGAYLSGIREADKIISHFQ